MTRKIGILMLLAFILRLAAIFILGRHLNPVIWEYDTIALNILSGSGYVCENHGQSAYLFGPSPLYAYLEALIHLVTNKNYFILEIVHVGVAALSVIPLFHITRKIFNEKTAIICGLLYCMHPGLIVYATEIHEFTFVMFFILTIMYFLIYFENKRWSTVFAGVLIGFGILLRPTLVFIIPSFFVYLVVKREGLGKIVSSTLLISFLAAIIISPWIYRGYKIYNRFIFITTTSAEHFWRGNNPHASGSALTRDNQPIFSVADDEFKNKIMTMNEIEQFDFFRSEAKRYIKENPIKFLENTSQKFMYFWWFSPQTGLTYPRYWLVIYKLLYYFLAFFFITGLCFIFVDKSKIDFPGIVFMFFLFITISLIHSLFYVEMRHRWLLEPLLMSISAYGLHRTFWSLIIAKSVKDNLKPMAR